DYLSIAGHPFVETPNIDSFINHGAYFPNAYSEIPSTTGARACMLRGRSSYYSGFRGYAAVEWNEMNSLADVLAKNGYHCINIGFRNLHPRRKLYGFHTVIPHDIREGVDDYMEWLRQMVGPNASEFGHGLNPNGWTARPWHLEERFHPVVWGVDKTLEMLRKRDPTRPFFVWLSFLRPHSPYDPPRSFWDMYIDRELPEPPIGDWAKKYAVSNPGLPINTWYGKFTPEQTYRMRAAYMAMISFIDSQIGRLLTALGRDLGVLDNTLVIFVSDHGDMMGDHNLHRKTYAFEGSARIPFLVKYPKDWNLPSGIFDHVVGLEDVMPTILEAAGIKPVAGITGRSVFGAIRGNSWRKYIHGEHSPHYSLQLGMHYLTDGHEKYIWFPATNEEMLFNLEKDRNELHNLAEDSEYKDRVRYWRSKLIEVLSKRGDGFSDGKKLIPKSEWWSPVVEEFLKK
ncbi:MAG: arylsulfatase, partial [Thermoprotei archaeon]